MLNSKYEKIVSELETKFPYSVVLLDEPMKGHTTFKIGGPADIFIEPTFGDIVGIIEVLKENGLPFTLIGNGSNLLVSDEGIEGAVISLGKLSSEIIVKDNVIEAQAGAMLGAVANAAAKAGLTGLEFASGIPGTVGGAVFMNAGAYGGEIKDILETVQVLTTDGCIKELKVDELDLSYRHSIFMDRADFVLKATFVLSVGDEDEIRAKMADIKAKRIEKQPLNFPSAGSTFKRPEGYFAGKLIDDAGLRGYSVNDAQVSEKHCGFVVNKGNATCSDVLRLMQDVDEKVFKDFGVHLNPEVRIIGRNID